MRRRKSTDFDGNAGVLSVLRRRGMAFSSAPPRGSASSSPLSLRLTAMMTAVVRAPYASDEAEARREEEVEKSGERAASPREEEPSGSGARSRAARRRAHGLALLGEHDVALIGGSGAFVFSGWEIRHREVAWRDALRGSLMQSCLMLRAVAATGGSALGRRTLWRYHR